MAVLISLLHLFEHFDRVLCLGIDASGGGDVIDIALIRGGGGASNGFLADHLGLLLFGIRVTPGNRRTRSHRVVGIAIHRPNVHTLIF